jgi:hypothetical protein
VRVYGYARLSVGYCGYLIREHRTTSTSLDYNECSCAHAFQWESLSCTAAFGNIVKVTKVISSQYRFHCILLIVIFITLLLRLFVTSCCRDGPATARLVTRNLLRIREFLLQFVNKSLRRRNLVPKFLSCSSFGDNVIYFFRR